ncbi:hypothetical protein DYB34_013097, partial [Aphanomyces astaci]
IESSHKAFKDGYRRALDAAMVDSAETKLMVEEANVAFELNMALFQDLDELRGVPVVHNTEFTIVRTSDIWTSYKSRMSTKLNKKEGSRDMAKCT